MPVPLFTDPSHGLPVIIHPSQFDDPRTAILLQSFKTRCIASRFHYDSARQTRLWLKLHQSYSPARRDSKIKSLYSTTARQLSPFLTNRQPLHIISLGCGSGHKDVTFLKTLTKTGHPCVYTAHDISAPMTIAAARLVAQKTGVPQTPTISADLDALCQDRSFIDSLTPAKHARVWLLFGVIPNSSSKRFFENAARLTARRGDRLVFSANLAPISSLLSFKKATESILPQYDNLLTREWLFSFLRDQGFPGSLKDLNFRIGPCPEKTGIWRVECRYKLPRNYTCDVEGKTIRFAKGESILLFYSNRHTPESITRLLSLQCLDLLSTHIAPSREEGVFIAGKNGT